MRSLHEKSRSKPAPAFVAGLACSLALAALAVLSSCERVPVGKGHVYRCSEGVVVRVVYSETDETATVRFTGKTYRLKLVPSGSGARYSDGKVVFWNKGDEAIILVNGELVHDGCRLVESEARRP